MSTVPLRCPDCGIWLRVAAQVSVISRVNEDSLRVTFDTQTVAHVCKPISGIDLTDSRRRAHTLDDCWCGMPHQPEDFT